MDVLIRGIDQDVVRRLEEQARKQNITRNRYICRQLSLIARYPELKEQEENYGKLLKMTVSALKDNQNMMGELLNTLEGGDD